MRYVILALLAFAAHVQAATGTAEISWRLPTTSIDGVPLTGANALTAVEVYVATSPIADSATLAPVITLGPGVTTTNYTTAVTNGQTLYVRLKAVSGSQKSVFSNQATKLITLSTVPGVPTNVTITLTIG